MQVRIISEFGAVVTLAYHPIIAPLLIFESFEGFGLKAVYPAVVLLILPVVSVCLYWISKPKDQQESEP
ncbi:MAG: hypothetical protein GYA34_13300 [Chloroflexi bacterium]|nr:hypothetical protein [Chloroflexota bacterium]